MKVRYSALYLRKQDNETHYLQPSSSSRQIGSINLTAQIRAHLGTLTLAGSLYLSSFITTYRGIPKSVDSDSY